MKTSSKTLVFFSYLICVISLIILFFISINLGSIKVTPKQLFDGLFISYDNDVASIYDLRFPRIIISVFAGAAISAAGVIFQAVLKNPLADPGILGISSGASFAAVLVTMLLPNLYFLTPAFAFMGGLLVFAIIYSLAWKESMSPLRIILMGVAMQALFSGLSSAINSMSAGTTSSVASIVEGNISMKTWDDVKIILIIFAIGIIPTIFSANYCNLCGLEDKTVRGLGVNIDRVRVILSLIAVFMVSGAAAIVGSVSFLGLLVPHIGRIFVGNDHRRLLPFSMILGAVFFLVADTLGRTIAYPYEISASVILAVVGGVIFIILLRRDGGIYGK